MYSDKQSSKEYFLDFATGNALNILDLLFFNRLINNSSLLIFRNKINLPLLNLLSLQL